MNIVACLVLCMLINSLRRQNYKSICGFVEKPKYGLFSLSSYIDGSCPSVLTYIVNE